MGSAGWSRVEGCPPRRRGGQTGGLASWTQPECERAAANHLGTKAHLGLRACEPLAAGSQLHTHKRKRGSAVRVWAMVPSAEACRAVFVEPESRRGRRGGKERRAPCARSGAAHALSEPGFWQDQVAEIVAVLMERERRGKSYPGHGASGLREGHLCSSGGMEQTAGTSRKTAVRGSATRGNICRSIFIGNVACLGKNTLRICNLQRRRRRQMIGLCII
eukprot:COSAG06_NODE_5983_length_3170_cov_1.183654_6_plen_219_part_00